VRTCLKPGEQGAKYWHSVTVQGFELEFNYGYERNPCLTLLHLEHAVKQQRWRETSGKSTFYAVDEKVYLLGLNCSNYKGINYQLMSRILGLYPTGVKRKPTVKCNHVPLCERRKRNNWSEFSDWVNCN
jgi:hypothetical protein